MTDSPGEGQVRVTSEVGDGILRIRLDHPARKNALDAASIEHMVRVLEAASTDDSLRAISIAGAGSDFCGGADWVATNAGSGPPPRPASIQRRLPLQAHRLVELLTDIQLPVVCAVQGWAAGIGCQIALASDFTIAADDARFWMPFTKRGFTPDSGATWLIPRLVGVARAKEMLLLGRNVTGAQAAEWGLIHRAVPAGDVDEAASELLAELAAAATVALGLTKRCINQSLSLDLAGAMDKEAMALELSSRTADFKEGLRAFTERRDAEFEGR